MGMRRTCSLCGVKGWRLRWTGPSLRWAHQRCFRDWDRAAERAELEELVPGRALVAGRLDGLERRRHRPHVARARRAARRKLIARGYGHLVGGAP